MKVRASLRRWNRSEWRDPPDLEPASRTRVCLCVRVPDAEVELEGVPVAPLDVRCHDANKDYVVVTWKQPAVEGSSPILGYYIDRLVGSPFLPFLQKNLTNNHHFMT